MPNVDATMGTQDRPLQAALEAAVEAHAATATAYDNCACDLSENTQCVHYHAMMAADEAVDAARSCLRDSNERRAWILREEGCDYLTVETSSAQEALEEARSNVDRSNYSDAEGTIWIGVSVRCEETGEEASATVTCDEEEPDCSPDEAEHDWQSPHEIVGGLEDTPGVRGHGGGVIIHEVCMRCGCERTTDTWAQNRETGEEGLRSVSYEEGKYAAEVRRARLASERDDVIAVLEGCISDADECEREPNVFLVSWEKSREERDIVGEIRARLPEGWRCDWTDSGNTDAGGGTTNDFIVEPE